MASNKREREVARLSPQVIRIVRAMIREEIDNLANGATIANRRQRQYLEQYVDGQVSQLREQLTRRRWWQFWKLKARP